jgi:16S rRNA processing protein RimM
VDYIHIGKIVATFGVRGELILKHALGKKTSLKGVEAIFIEERKGSYLPYFLQSGKAKTVEEAYLKIDGINSKESASRLIQKQVWLQEKEFRKLVDKASPLNLLGFEVMHEGESLGVIEEIIEQPHQVLLRLTISDKEALIPLHDQTMRNVDRENKLVHVILPDGLLDIYK